jgi:hypothetical protein
MVCSVVRRAAELVAQIGVREIAVVTVQSVGG